jgi:hypothetical protein
MLIPLTIAPTVVVNGQQLRVVAMCTYPHLIILITTIKCNIAIDILLFVRDNYRLNFYCIQSKLNTTPREAKTVVIAN